MFDQLLRSIKDSLISPLTHYFSFFHPTTITYISLSAGILCCISILAKTSVLVHLILWALNRLLDNLDGSVARLTGTTSDFGGHIDLMSDFIIYCGIPISITMTKPSHELYLVLSFLLSTYTLNAVGLFHLSSILEKKGEGTKSTKEKTTITMPTSIIEGGETGLMYTLFLLFPEYSYSLFLIFAMLVSITILYRLYWARMNLK